MLLFVFAHQHLLGIKPLHQTAKYLQSALNQLLDIEHG